VYHQVSEAHLHRYLAEFDFRYNNRTGLGVNDKERAEKAIKAMVGKRLTYRGLTKPAFVRYLDRKREYQKRSIDQPDPLPVLKDTPAVSNY
jgi:hypothetical protein